MMVAKTDHFLSIVKSPFLVWIFYWSDLWENMGKHGKTFFEIPNTHAISIGFPMFSRGFPAGCLMMSGFKRSIAMMIAKSHGKSRLVAIGQLGNWMPLVNL